MIPYRIQRHVNKEYTTTQDAEFEIKSDEADNKVKIVIAKEFPEFYKKKYLDPYEEGSELYAENKDIIDKFQQEGNRMRQLKVEKALETTAMW